MAVMGRTRVVSRAICEIDRGNLRPPPKRINTVAASLLDA